MCVWRSIFILNSSSSNPHPNLLPKGYERRMPLGLEWLHRLGLQNLRPALLARASGIVVPEVEHRLTEGLDDVAAVEVDVLDERAAILAVEDNMLVLSGRTAALDHNTERVRRTNRRMRNIWRDEERLPFAHEVIDDPPALADAHFYVALELIEILFRIDEMKI